MLKIQHNVKKRCWNLQVKFYILRYVHHMTVIFITCLKERSLLKTLIFKSENTLKNYVRFIVIKSNGVVTQQIAIP